MKEVVFVVYEGDAWLSRSSLDVIGIYSSLEKAKRAVVCHFAPCYRKEVRKMVDSIKQTQGYNVNYHIEAWVLE